ncbi:TetR/AcrR family transcriptional regulator [Lysobacter niastensis]|uniref:TetR/AcrR family transcriptional regulator n=1 Tax=Lysobacter niastensis TaxID=380629 RepID=A0ABS0BAQ1_9GAMM|nr:TetR/AcrR family transcriptional regulator [Lysobacter niastensis]MBF6024771.1 TetR/AcrR family transcriptional regulator [Lysobacter niastensis]
MSALTATTKGAATREAIIDRAYGIACSAGLEGLSIGPLAHAVGMSKSGVFAHFGSREDLQLAVLDAAGERFVAQVLYPALKAPRGIPRLRAIAEGWFEWARQSEGGCVLLSAASEYDDRPGPLRDRIIRNERLWREQITRAVQIAVDAGDVAADTDAEQMAFELYALALTVHHDAGLFGFELAVSRGRRALERLFRSYTP